MLREDAGPKADDGIPSKPENQADLFNGKDPIGIDILGFNVVHFPMQLPGFFFFRAKKSAELLQCEDMMQKFILVSALPGYLPCIMLFGAFLANSFILLNSMIHRMFN